jgi:peptidylprolyl isomerase
MKSAPIALAALLLAAATPALAATPAPAIAAADWRTPDAENVLVVDTSKGRVIVELAPWAAPVHVERVRSLARQGFYDGLTFFRVIDDFMAQTGDPKNDGTGGNDAQAGHEGGIHVPPRPRPALHLAGPHGAG